jgi:hypothetical protein
MTRTAKRHLIAAFCFAVGYAGSAQAGVIFTDTFDRANSNTVGNGWVITNHVSVDDHTMLMKGNTAHEQPPITSQIVVSTIGLENIQFSYDWQGDGGEADDTLNVFWSTDGSTFHALASHSLGSASIVNSSWSLPDAADISSLTIRYSFTGDMGNDGARIDNVSVTGETSPTSAAVTAVPEPGSLALLGSGLVAFGFVRRRLGRRWRS